jgi:hypothetical protein
MNMTTNSRNSFRPYANASLNPQIILPRWTFLMTTGSPPLIWSTVGAHVNMISFGALHASVHLLTLPPFLFQRELPLLPHHQTPYHQREFLLLPCHKTHYHLFHPRSMMFLLFQRETMPLCPLLFLMIQKKAISLCPPLLLPLVFPPEIVAVLGKTVLPLTTAIPMVNGRLASLVSWLSHSMPLRWLPLGPNLHLPLLMLVQVVLLAMVRLGFTMDSSQNWLSFKEIGRVSALRLATAPFPCFLPIFNQISLMKWGPSPSLMFSPISSLLSPPRMPSTVLPTLKPSIVLVLRNGGMLWSLN